MNALSTPPRILLVGLSEALARSIEQFVASGKQERGEKAEETNEFVLAGLGAVSTLREQSQKLFDDLVSTGEKERA